MADTEILLSTSLQTPSSSCNNCLSSETAGQNQVVGGNFNAHLNGSLKELSASSGGDVLPIDGKDLPQAILPQEQKDLKSTLQSLLKDIQVDDIDSNLLATSLNETLQEGIDTNIPILQQHLDISPETALETFSKLTNLQNLSGSIEDAVISQHQNANELVSQIIDELNAIPIPVSQTNNVAVKTAQIDNLSSVAGILDNQRVLTGVTQPVDGELQQLLTNNTTIEVEEPVVFSNTQKFDSSENVSEELNDFIAKFLSEDSSAKIISKNQPLSAEIFQQNINSIKAESTLQNLNLGAAADSYANQNIGSLQNKSIEAPIPLLIKQGAAAEQVQQGVDQSIAQNVKWLIGNKAQNAKINVFPESLGQVNIALSLEDSNLKLNFIASSSVTKELIEASVATLKNQFSESGINLQEVNVETRFSSQSEQSSQFSDLQDKDENHLNNVFEVSSSEKDDLAPLEFVNNSAPLYLLDAYV
ncbi:MAG: flagellar hook-length control protein FliK [Gammaproteobacteria bacterium]|nr:flagellar hook-length control protein FliK [Gammaproteobacteria bacterium]